MRGVPSLRLYIDELMHITQGAQSLDNFYDCLPALCQFPVLHTESPAAFVSSTCTADMLRVVRQVSHCGKPQCTAPSEKPLRLSRLRSTCRWASPLGTPGKGFPLCTPEHDKTAIGSADHPPDALCRLRRFGLRVSPLHPTKGVAPLWDPAPA